MDGSVKLICYIQVNKSEPLLDGLHQNFAQTDVDAPQKINPNYFGNCQTFFQCPQQVQFLHLSSEKSKHLLDGLTAGFVETLT